MEDDETLRLRDVAFTAALTALAWVTTMVIRVPIPATTGYFNIGDVFVILAGLWLGPKSAFFVGAVGPTLADAIGYPQFIVATAIVKSTEGLVTGLIAKAMPSRGWVAAACGAIVMVVGYFIFEGFIYPALATAIPFFAVTSFGAALVELPINAFQGFIGAAVAFGLWRLMPAPRDSDQTTV